MRLLNKRGGGVEFIVPQKLELTNIIIDGIDSYKPTCN